MQSKRILFYIMAFLIITMLTFGGCSSGGNGGNGGNSDNNYIEELENWEPTKEYDIPLPEGSFKLVGGSPDTFISRNGLSWSLEGSEFHTRYPEDFKLIINGNRVPADSLIIDKYLLTANITLTDGRNEVLLEAHDIVGRTYYYNKTLWAGNNTITVSLMKNDGTPFTTQTNVVASVGDDPTVAVRVVTTNGIATLVNAPDRTILIEALSVNNDFGNASIIGAQSTVTINMIEFDTPVTIKNHDFSKSTESWKFSSGTRFELIPHKEVIPGFPDTSNILPMMQIANHNPIPNQNLLIGTSGQGERSASYTFTTEPGTIAVRIRYRFITSEFPRYFGSRYNDSYRISIASQRSGTIISESRSMNGLGREAFNEAGETNWRESILHVNEGGDTIQINVGVTNVGDGQYDSQVVIAFVEEIGEQARVRAQLAWNNTNGGLNLTWEVLREPLTESATIDVHFADGTQYDNRIGERVFSHVIPANTQPGRGGPVHINGQLLANCIAPHGITYYYIAFNHPSLVGSIQDVNVVYGQHADQTTVYDELYNIIKAGQRVSGANSLTITSTTRSPYDQARIMFDLLLGGNPLRFYRAPGQEVITVYRTMTRGNTNAQISERREEIINAMEAKIIELLNEREPRIVSNHTVNPQVISVVDIAITNVLGPLFRNYVTQRVTRFLDEREFDPPINCYHVELRAVDR